MVRTIERPHRAVVVDHRDVLDTHAEATGQVDAGLDRERHSGFERLAIPADQVRMLVAVETDPMTDPVDEVRTVSGFIDDPSRRGVDRLGRCALVRSGVAGFLRPADDVMHTLPLALDGRPDVHRPRDVGSIAAASAAEVEDDRVTLHDAAIAGLMMRRRAVRTGRDDRESDFLVSLVTQQARELRTDLALRAPGERTAEHSRVRAIGGLRDEAQRIPFDRVLAHPHLARDLRRDAERAFGQR